MQISHQVTPASQLLKNTQYNTTDNSYLWVMNIIFITYELTFSLLAAYSFMTSADIDQHAHPCSLIITWTVCFSVSNISVATTRSDERYFLFWKTNKLI